MKLYISTIFIVLLWMNFGAISIAQSGGTVFQDYCSGCHSSDFTSDNIVTGNAVAPALGPYVEQFSAAVFVANIRNDRLLAPPMRTFEGELTDAQLRSVWQHITDVMRGDATPVPRGETQEQRIKREKCEAIKTRMNTPPTEPPEYYPPGHDRCSCGDSGEDYCNRTGIFGEGIEPLRPRNARYCKPWVWQSERDYYGNYCRTVQMVGDVSMTIAPPPLPQAPEKLKRAMKEQPLNNALGKRKLTIPKTPQNTPVPVPERTEPGPVPASAEIRCRAGGGMRLEATRPASLNWVPRWERRRGAEIERGGGKPDKFDEHWAFVVYATLAPVGTERPAPGQCIWSAPNAHGLQLNDKDPIPIAIDMRILSDHFPFDRMTIEAGGRTNFAPRDRRGIGRQDPTRTALEALSAIQANRGEFTAPVMPSEKPAPFKGAIVEHTGNNTFGFREPPTARIIGPY